MISKIRYSNCNINFGKTFKKPYISNPISSSSIESKTKNKTCDSFEKSSDTACNKTFTNKIPKQINGRMAVLIALMIATAALSGHGDTSDAVQTDAEYDTYADLSDIKKLYGAYTAAESEYDSEMKVIAHRGYSAIAPENTLAAFITAAANGFDTIECDVRWTEDSIPVILHDKTINETARKADGSKLIFNKKCSDLTYEELLNYDFGIYKGDGYAGTKIPTFYEMLDCCKEYGLNIYIELKEDEGFDEEKADILVNAVKEAGLEDNVTWISFNRDYLQMINNIAPDCRLGYLTETEITDKTVKILESLKTNDNEVFIDIKESEITEEGADILHNAGFEIEAWNVNGLNDLDNLYKYECKGVTTSNLTEKIIDAYLYLLDEQ